MKVKNVIYIIIASAILCFIEHNIDLDWGYIHHLLNKLFIILLILALGLILLLLVIVFAVIIVVLSCHIAKALKRECQKIIIRLTKNIELYYENDRWHSRNAEDYERTGQYEKAIKEYTEIMNLAPWDDKAKVKLAGLYEKLEQYDKAIEYYSTLSPYNTVRDYISPNDNYIQCIRICEQLGQYEKVIEYYTKLIEEGTSYYASQFYFERANVYLKIGEKDKAISDLKKSAFLDLFNDKAKNSLKELGIEFNNDSSYY